MFATLLAVFVLLGLYAIFGNIFVYAYLVRCGVPVRFAFSGTPGYLASVCSKNVAAVGLTLLWVARSAVFAFLACAVLGVGLFAHG